MRNVAHLPILLGLGVALPAPTWSQEPAPLLPAGTSLSVASMGSRFQETVVAPGARVRVSFTNPDTVGGEPQRYVGTLVAVGAADLLLEREEEEGIVSLPMTSLTRFSVHRGKKGSGLWGAAIGFAATFLVGQFLPEEEATPGGAGLEGLLLLAAGTGVGAIVGSQIERDRWEDVPLDRLAPVGGREPAVRRPQSPPDPAR